MSRFLSPRFDRLVPYVPGEQPQNRSYVKLNTNESPFPPSPAVIEAVTREADTLNLYSDPECRVLREAIAAHFGLKKENVFVGNGSDEILAFSFLAFCDAKTGACYPDITYGFYRVYSDLCCIDGKEIPLREDFSVDPAAYCRTGRTVYLANPNAPTGMALGLDAIETVVRENPDHVVVIDEAYVDFGAESAARLVGKYDNLLVVRTYSKSRNMAGARLGFCLAGEALIGDLNTVKFSFNPYNVDRLALAAGLAAIRDTAYFAECIGKIRRTRGETVRALREMGFTVLPSEANFVFARKEGTDGKSLYLRLKERGVLVRHFDKERISDFLRITIGTEEQMAVLLGALKEILGEDGGRKA